MIHEVLMGHGEFTVALKAAGPGQVAATVVEFGHLVVTDTHVDPDEYGDAGMLALARYTGVVTQPAANHDGPTQIVGHGLLSHLGDWDGKGDILETAWTGPGTKNFANWISGLLGTINSTPSPITAGTISTVTAPAAGEWSDPFIYSNRRQILDQLADYYSAEYRANPDGTLDAGTESDLFTTTPTVVVAVDAGPDATVDGWPAEVLNVVFDAEDWSSEVVLFGSGQQTDTINVGTASVGSNPYKDLQGNALVRKRPVSSPLDGSATADTVAASQLNRFSTVGAAVTVSVAAGQTPFRAAAEPGDSIYLWEPAANLADTANVIWHQGEAWFPTVRRIYEIRWPVTAGMGVYYRDADGGYTDLTQWVQPDSGATQLVVGLKTRKPVTRETPPIPDRTFLQQIVNANVSDLSADKITAGDYTLGSGQHIDTGSAAHIADTNGAIADQVYAGTLGNSRLPSVISGQYIRPTSGSVSAPGAGFASQTSSGLWLAAAGDVRLSSAGLQLARWSSSLIYYTSTIRPGGDNLYYLGGSAARYVDVYAVSGSVNTSDENEKMDLADSPLGLEFIVALSKRAARQFRWKDSPDTQTHEEIDRRIAALDVELQREFAAYDRAVAREEELRRKHPEVHRPYVEPDGSKVEALQAQIVDLVRQKDAARRPGRRLHHGLTAQGVQAALTDVGSDTMRFGGVVIPTDGSPQGLRYDQFIAPLVNAVAQLAARVQALEAR